MWPHLAPSCSSHCVSSCCSGCFAISSECRLCGPFPHKTSFQHSNDKWRLAAACLRRFCGGASAIESQSILGCEQDYGCTDQFLGSGGLKKHETIRQCYHPGLESYHSICVGIFCCPSPWKCVLFCFWVPGKYS